MSMTSDNVLSETPRRGWLPHPLWLLVVAVVLVGVGIVCTVLLSPTTRLIREVKALGGRVDSEYGGPEWLSDLIDDDRLTMFHRLQWVALHETSITDEWLTRLNGDQDLLILELDGTRISDAGIAGLKNLPNLRHLSLRGTQVGNER